MSRFFGKSGSSKKSIPGTEVERTRTANIVILDSFGGEGALTHTDFTSRLDLWFQDEYETLNIQTAHAEDAADCDYYFTKRAELMRAQRILNNEFITDPTSDVNEVVIVLASEVSNTPGVSLAQQEAWTRAEELVSYTALGLSPSA